MPDIYEYTNYREYLRDFYEHKKAGEGYTYRDFAREAGMNSSSWLMHLIKGQKNLTPESVLRAARALKLRKKELAYFELMVMFTQSKTSQAKNHYYQQMIAVKRQLKLINITEEQYEYYSRWYHPVIRSLVSKLDFGEDYARLGRNLVPAISAAEARKSVNLLQKLGFIRQEKSGRWIQTQNIISTGDEVHSLNLVNYHKQVAALAADAHDRMSPELRDISAMTLGINREDFEKIKARIREFRKEIIDIAGASKNEDRVCQLNFQFFHVNRVEEEK